MNCYQQYILNIWRMLRFRMWRRTTVFLRNRYGWFPKISLLEDLPEVYEAYCEETNHKARKIDVLQDFLNQHKTLLKVAELLITFCFLNY